MNCINERIGLTQLNASIKQMCLRELGKMNKIIDNDSEIAELLLMDYTNRIDYSFMSQCRKRKLKCGFCARTYKYQVVLNDHVVKDHMVDLKKITDLDRMQLIQHYMNETTYISYAKFHQKYLKDI